MVISKKSRKICGKWRNCLFATISMLPLAFSKGGESSQMTIFISNENGKKFFKRIENAISLFPTAFFKRLVQ